MSKTAIGFGCVGCVCVVFIFSLITTFNPTLVLHEGHLKYADSNKIVFSDGYTWTGNVNLLMEDGNSTIPFNGNTIYIIAATSNRLFWIFQVTGYPTLYQVNLTPMPNPYWNGTQGRAIARFWDNITDAG